MLTESEQRVRRGAAVLDHFCPDWEFRIRPEQITNISDPDCCVLRQTHGQFNAGWEAMFGSISYPEIWATANMISDCGFAAGTCTADWQALIAERRAAVPELVEVS